MDQKELELLAAQYKIALRKDLGAREAWERRANALAAEAHGTGLIDGKNAEQRKIQLTTILHGDGALATMSMECEVAECERKGQEAYIGMLKAWFYSQAGMSN